MNIQDQVLNLEASKAIKEFLGESAPESLFWWRLGYSTSESFDQGVSTGKHGHFRDYEIQYLPKPRYMTSDIKWNTKDLSKIDHTELPACTFTELVVEVLPLLKTKMTPEYVKTELFVALISGGMSAVSERVISLIKE